MEKLHKDMYNLRHPGISIDEVKPLDPDPLAQVRYACVHWIDHLCEIASSSYDQIGLYDNRKIHKFLKEHFLHWMEALSLTRSMSTGVVMIRKLEDLLAVRFNQSQLCDLVQDEVQFILHNRWIIENAPLQTYASALVFSPIHSVTRQQWKKEEPEWIITKPIVESDWSLCLQTLEGHGSWVRSVVFSHDSRQLASGSNDRTVKIWDAETGKCLQTLEGHGSSVTSVVFSHDSRQLASGSRDGTVKIWDAETGKCLQTLCLQTLDSGFLASSISFDPARSYLFTERGTIALGQSSSVRCIRDSGYAPVIGDNVSVPDDAVGLREHDWAGYGLSSNRAWITWRGQNLLWLPSGYRPGMFVISGATVGIGCSNRRIIVIYFSSAGPSDRHNKASET